MNLEVRAGNIEDAPAIYQLIKELAIYEKALDNLVLSEEQFTADGFLMAPPAYETLVALADEKVVGMALYYNRYSTWNGRSIYLEDFAVTKEYRNNGVGERIFNALQEIALKNEARLLTWQVIDWNEPAIKFYKKNCADLEEEWINCRLSAEQMRQNLSE